MTATASEPLLRRLLAEAKELANRLNLSASERADLAKRVADVEEVKGRVDREKQIAESLKGLAPAQDESVGSYGLGSGLQQRYLSAGWDIESRPKVQLGNLFGRKALMADGSDAQSLFFPEVAGLGADSRFVFPAFPSVGLGDATTVQGLVQTVRTFTPSAMDVALTGTTTKTESVLTAALTTVDAKMIAHTTELIPNALFKLPQFGAFIQKEMSYGLGLGIDLELITSLAAASGTTTYSQGSETLFQTYRNSIKTARAAGYAPNLAILHPNDAAKLDLEADDVSRFYGAGPTGKTGFPSLWGLKVVESVSATAGFPILVDTEAWGTLYFGGVEWAANPYEEFRSNRSRGRLEVPMAVVVEQAAGIVEVTLN